MLTYDDYKAKYPDTTLTEDKFDIYFFIVYNKIKSYSVYDLEKLPLERRVEILFYICFQINYFENNGIENSGIVSQSILSTSISKNSDKKEGDTNFSQVFLNWLYSSGLNYRWY